MIIHGVKSIIVSVFVMVLFIVSANAGYYKEVRDWYVYCTDVLVCNFDTSIDGDALYRFGFSRAPTANAPVELFAVGKISATASIQLIVDEAETIFEVGQGRLDEDQTLRFSIGDQQQALLTAMMSGSKLTVVLQDGVQKHQFAASLSGVTGSALFVDDIQQNLDHRDALTAKGEKPASDATITVVELAQTSDLPDVVAAFWTEHTDLCAEGYEGREDLIKELGGLKIQMEEEVELYLLPCGLPGAYNYPQTALMLNSETNRVRQLSFPIIGDDGPTLDLTPFNINWDARDRTLSSFYKGRGLGDCGMRATWKIKGSYYSNVILVRQEQKDDCDGNYKDWPVLWPVQ